MGSVQFSRSVVSDSWRPHESQHTRHPCSSPSPGVHSDSRPSSQWCHLAISSSVIPFSSCPQSLPASESFPVSQLFAWGGQSTGVLALASFLPKKSQGSYLSIITLNVNGLNAPTKKAKTGWMDTKTRPLYMLSTRDPPQNKGHIQTESEGLEKDIPRK